MDTLGTTTVSAPVRSRKSLSMEREEPMPSASDQGTRSLATQSSGDSARDLVGEGDEGGAVDDGIVLASLRELPTGASLAAASLASLPITMKVFIDSRGSSASRWSQAVRTLSSRNWRR